MSDESHQSGPQATYHANGWKAKADCTVAKENSNGTVDLADASGAVFVSGLPVYSGEGDKPNGSYAVIGNAADKAAADKAAADKAAADKAAADKKSSGKGSK